MGCCTSIYKQSRSIFIHLSIIFPTLYPMVSGRDCWSQHTSGRTHTSFTLTSRGNLGSPLTITLCQPVQFCQFTARFQTGTFSSDQIKLTLFYLHIALRATKLLTLDRTKQPLASIMTSSNILLNGCSLLRIKML